LKTKITQLLNIKFPIIQGGMAWVSEANLTAAVSNAGGLGIIAAGNAPANWVLEQIKLTRQKTNKPFGVNVMMLSPFVEQVMEVIYKEKVPVVTIGAGNPAKYVKKLKSAGIIVIPVVASCAIAKKMERRGVDAVIAEGMEAGGHIGKLTTMALVPQVVDTVSIPVIAAGGIADGRAIAASFSLGAEAVQIGTRFICSTECTVAEEYKKLVVKAKDRDTLITGKITGHPVRCLKSKFSRELLNKEKENITIEEFEKLGIGSLNKAVQGNINEGTFMAGQISGLIHDIMSCDNIIKQLMKETKQIINNLKQY